jgi:regulator of protease activity HflC (stomatin/prohibitin superfamily)
MYGQQLLSRTLLENDFNYILKEGLEEYTQSLKSELQRTAGNELGVDIVDVSFVNFQPPPEVAESFQATLGALQDKEKQMTIAEKYVVSIVSKAEVLADKKVKGARSNTILKSLLLDAEAESFDEQLRAYKKTPLLYENQAVMIALESWIEDVRKIVNLTNASKEIITLELKKNEPGLMDME